MKTLIFSATLLLVFAVIVSAKPHRPPQSPETKEAWDACYKELDITEKDYHQRKRNDEYKTEDCLRACVDKKLGLINEDGKIDKEVAIKNFPPHVPKENVTKIVDECSLLKGDNDCQTSVLYRQCSKPIKSHRPLLSPERKEAWDACRKEFNITEEDHHERKRNDENNKEDCLRACVDKKSGLINEDGIIVREAAIKNFPPHVPEESVTKIVDECSILKGENDCQTSVLYRQCVKKSDPRKAMFRERKKAHGACKEELKLSDEEVTKLRESWRDATEDCFLLCTGQKLGFLNEDGTINKEGFVKGSPPHRVDEAGTIADECVKELDGAKGCQGALGAYKCFFKNDSKVHGHDFGINLPYQDQEKPHDD